MRFGQTIWRIVIYSQVNPFGLIEILMLSLATVLLLIWNFTLQWPYLVISLSYAIGAASSVLVRSNFMVFPQRGWNRLTALSIIFLSICAFVYA
jgi:hypothetical protein